MKRIVNLIFILLFSSHLYGSDIVVNVDPNPVVISDFVRVSVVSEFPIQEAMLLVGNDVFPLKRVTDQLFKLKFKSFVELNSDNIFVNVIFSSSSQVHLLPVEITVIEQGMKDTIVQGQSLDVKNSQAIKIDNTKIEIERLEDKVDLLDQKNQTLNKEIKKLNKSLANQKKLALTNEEIKSQQARLLELQQLFEKEKLAKQASVIELKRKMEVFNTKQQAMNAREASLTSLELELSERSQALLNQGVEFEKDKSLLKEKELVVDNQRNILKKAQKKVRKEEKMVEKLKYDIARQKKELTKQNKQIVKKEKELDAKMVTIALNQSSLVSKEEKLSNLSEKINGERHALVSISAKLDKKKKALEEEKSKFYVEKSDKEQVLKKAKQNIKSLENKMINTINTLASLEKDHLDKSVFIQKEKDYLRSQRLEYEQDKALFDNDYKKLQLLENEISVRVDIMNNLGAHIDGQLDQIHRQMVDSQHAQFTYESEMNDKVTYLNNLTKLIEKRAKKMEYKNKKLIIKNKKLNTQVNDLKSPFYRYSFSPYFGVRLGDVTKSKYDEFGITFTTFLRKGLSLSSSIGSVNYMHKFNSDYTQIVDSRVGNVSLLYLVNPKEKLGFYLRALARRELSSGDVPTFFGFGFDLKYHYNNDFSSFVSAQISDGSYLSFGIEKYIISIYSKSQDGYANNNQAEYDFVDSDLDTKDDSYVAISKIDPYFCFFPRVKTFKDVSSSWYKDSVEKTASYGLFNLYQNDMFNPRGYLTYKDASYSLVWTRYLDQVLFPKPIEVSFSLISDLHQSLLVTFSILDEEGNKVVVINDKTEYFVGNHELVIDPQKLSLKEGRYRLLCDIYSHEVIKGDQEYFVKDVFVGSSEQFFDVKSVESLVNVPSLKSEFRAKDKYPFLKKAVQFDWFRFSKKELDLFSNVAVTRLEFIEIIGRFLLQSGARSRNIEIDLTYYNDLHLIPKSKQKYLKEYIVELGYGGDHNQNLNPYQYLTRAEFAVIMNRLLVWKQKMLKDKNIDFNFDKVVIN
tara:strand:+ start:453 stop:3521 length:3069 start_codon:yes stop_codon:yes gene_type:complete